MPKFEVKMEATITYEVTVEADGGDKAERAAEMIPPTNFHVDAVRALWTRDITPVEDQIEGWIKQLQARGYGVTPPKTHKRNSVASGGHADTITSETGDGAVREDEAGSV